MFDLVKRALIERGLEEFLTEEMSARDMLHEFVNYLEEESYSPYIQYNLEGFAYRYVIHSITIAGNIHHFAMLRSVDDETYYDIETLREVTPTPLTQEMIDRFKCYVHNDRYMLATSLSGSKYL